MASMDIQPRKTKATIRNFFQLQGVKYTRGNLLILKPFTWICWFGGWKKVGSYFLSPKMVGISMVMTFPWDRIRKKSPKTQIQVQVVS